MRDFLSRVTPLAVCPNLTCRRAGVCHHLAQDRKCLKDNYASEDERRLALADRLMKIADGWGLLRPDPKAPPMTEDEWSEVKVELRKAVDTLKAENPERYR